MRKILCVAVLAVLATAGSAWALEPQQVLVVANRNVPESVALGRLYCDRRQVPLENLVELDLPTGPAMSSSQYRQLLVEPLRQVLDERGLRERIACVLTLHGVPYRISADTPSPGRTAMLDWCGQAIGQTHAQFAQAVELLKHVGSHFPPSARNVTGVESLQGLFDVSVTLPSPLPSFENLAQEFDRLRRNRAQRISEVSDPVQRQIAQRQMVALMRHVGGLPGMVQAARMHRVEGLPSEQQVQQHMQELQQRLQQFTGGQTAPEDLATLQRELLEPLGGLVGIHRFASQQQQVLRIMTSAAAVDSELAVLWWEGYPREGWMPNPLHWRVAPEQREQVFEQAGPMLMVSRLDGPRLEDLVRVIRDSQAVEAVGLRGTVYIDAGGREPSFDKGLEGLADQLRRQTRLRVHLDKSPQVLRPGSAPDAGVYVGWYSLQKYVPAFTWNRGAVGIHVASWEAQNLRDLDSQEWVPQLLANGIAATVGAADEPLLDAFPRPDEFFLLLLSGKLTIAEVYWRTVPHVAWRMMLFADPLYTPFRVNPQPVQLPEGMSADR